MIEDSTRVLQRAATLRDSGDLEGARTLLVSVVEEFRDRAGFWLVLGDIQKELGDMRAAVASFRNAVELAPEHEVASHSLLCVLWRLGRAGDDDAEGDALAEIRRYRSATGSDSYDSIIAELHEKMDLLWPQDDEEADEGSGDDG